MPKASKKQTSTLILFVRHGRTPTTGKALPGRDMDLHLSDEGMLQAEVVAKRIASSYAIDAIYTSPITRAKETAAALTKATGAKAASNKDLAETDCGEWQGRLLKDVYKLPEWKWLQTNIGSFQFPGGESFTSLQNRVVKAMRDVNAKHPGQTVVMVTHADPIRAAVVSILQASLQAIHHIEVATCSVTAIRVDGAQGTVLAVGDTDDFRGAR